MLRRRLPPPLSAASDVERGVKNHMSARNGHNCVRHFSVIAPLQPPDVGFPHSFSSYSLTFHLIPQHSSAFHSVRTNAMISTRNIFHNERSWIDYYASPMSPYTLFDFDTVFLLFRLSVYSVLHQFSLFLITVLP
jgi:hypothetical protein